MRKIIIERYVHIVYAGFSGALMLVTINRYFPAASGSARYTSHIYVITDCSRKRFEDLSLDYGARFGEHIHLIACVQKGRQTP